MRSTMRHTAEGLAAYQKAAKDIGKAFPGGVRWGAVDRTVKIKSVDPNVTLEQTRTNNGGDGSGPGGAK